MQRLSANATSDRRSAPFRVRAYHRAKRSQARMRNVTTAVLDGCFLGVMDRDDLVYLDRAYYAVAREPIDGMRLGYTDTEHITSGLAAWEAAAIEAHFPAGGRVLVTGAGAGRELVGLLERGFAPLGFEPNEQLAAAGGALLAAQGHGACLQVSRRDEFPSDAPEADAVIVGWGSYGLIPGRRRRVAFLRGARERLSPQAPLLVSFFERPPTRYFEVVQQIAGPLRRLRRAEPIELGDALMPNYSHYFSHEEIESELAEGGFRLTQIISTPYAHAIARSS